MTDNPFTKMSDDLLVLHDESANGEKGKVMSLINKALDADLPIEDAKGLAENVRQRALALLQNMEAKLVESGLDEGDAMEAISSSRLGRSLNALVDQSNDIIGKNAPPKKLNKEEAVQARIDKVDVELDDLARKHMEETGEVDFYVAYEKVLDTKRGFELLNKRYELRHEYLTMPYDEVDETSSKAIDKKLIGLAKRRQDEVAMADFSLIDALEEVKGENPDLAKRASI